MDWWVWFLIGFFVGGYFWNQRYRNGINTLVIKTLMGIDKLLGGSKKDGD